MYPITRSGGREGLRLLEARSEGEVGVPLRKVFVLPVLEALRLKAGERGEAALGPAAP